MNTSELGAQLLLSDTYISVMAKGFATLFPLTTSVSRILFRLPFCGRARPEKSQCTPTSSAISLSRGQLHLVPSSHPVSFILFALLRTLPLYRSLDKYDCRIVQDDWMILLLVFWSRELLFKRGIIHPGAKIITRFNCENLVYQPIVRRILIKLSIF